MSQPISNIVRIRFDGDLDVSVKDQLADLLAPALLADIVILDLTATSYIDAAALGCLVRLKNQLRPRGGVVHLIGLRPGVRRTLGVTGLDKIFDLNDYGERSA